MDCHSKRGLFQCVDQLSYAGALKIGIKIEWFHEKKYSAALLLQILVFALMTSVCMQMKDGITFEKMNSDVQKLLENCGREIIGEEAFCSKNNNIMDYMIGFYDTD